MAYPVDTRRWTNAGPSRSWSGCEAVVTTRPAASSPFARCPARKGQGDQELTCRFERREKFANLPGALSEEAPRKNRYEVGDIAYWSPDHQVQAIDRGITFHGQLLGLQRRREPRPHGQSSKGRLPSVFLMDKIDGRTKVEAGEQIDTCLQRLQTDRIDLMQFHEVIRLEDPDRIFAEDGAFEAMMGAQKAGKVRYIGFT